MKIQNSEHTYIDRGTSDETDSNPRPHFKWGCCSEKAENAHIARNPNTCAVLPLDTGNVNRIQNKKCGLEEMKMQKGKTKKLSSALSKHRHTEHAQSSSQLVKKERI